MKEIKKLTRSQKALLQIRLAELDKAKLIVQQTVDQIGDELGVPQSENGQWVISDDLERIEKREGK